MKNSQITETDIWAYVSKQSDHDVIERVEEWMQSDHYDDSLFKQIESTYLITGKNPYQKQEPVDTNLAKQRFFDALEDHGNTSSQNNNWKSILKYAAIFALLFVSATYIFYLNNDTVTIQTAYGEHKQIDLPDGSTIWLNSSSKLTYDKDTPRTLYLEGEGFFEVAKNKEVPFTVDTPDHIRVMALGTSFNIKAYQKNKYTETVLLTGKVEVSSDTHFNNKVTMIPNDKVTFSQKDKKVVKEKVDFIENVVGWKSGKIQFRNKSFTEIAADLSNQYNVTIHFENEKVSNYKFTGTFDKGTPISEILEVLQLTKSFTYKTPSNNEFIIQ